MKRIIMIFLSVTMFIGVLPQSVWAKAPATGDPAQLGLWIGVMAASLVAAVAVLLFYRRKK